MKETKLKYQTEETEEFKKFIIILVIVLAVIIIAFGLSKIFLKSEVDELTYQAGEISTTAAIVGTMLNYSETEYYVLAYDKNGSNADAYTIYASYYTNQATDPLTIYTLDLSSVFNQAYYVTEGSNPKATKISDLKMLDGTLLRIKNGKIVEYIEGIDNIATELAIS